ncbi:hypothetical protein MTR67_011703, partial [Solanum verrucosum]
SHGSHEPKCGTMMTRIKDFTRMNPPEFHRSKVDEDLQEFIDEVCKIVRIMGLSAVEKEKPIAYQLKDIAQVWFEQWKSEKEYALKFTQLSKYAPTMVVDSRARMSKFVSGVFSLVVKEGRTTMLIKDMDISFFIMHVQQIEEEKYKEREWQSKRACMGSSNDPTPKFNKDSVSNSKPQGGSSGGSLMPACTSKVNVMVNSLHRLSMGNVANVEDDKKELVRDVHRLARLGVGLVDSNKSEPHNSRFFIHRVATKMYRDLWEVYWWKGMKKDIVEFVAKYPNCQQVKVEHQKLGGLAQNISISSWKLEEETMSQKYDRGYLHTIYNSLGGEVYLSFFPFFFIELGYNNNYHSSIGMTLGSL